MLQSEFTPAPTPSLASSLHLEKPFLDRILISLPFHRLPNTGHDLLGILTSLLTIDHDSEPDLLHVSDELGIGQLFGPLCHHRQRHSRQRYPVYEAHQELLLLL